VTRQQSCPACGGVVGPWLVVEPADASLTGSYALSRCDRCGTARTQGAVSASAHESGTYRPVAPRGRRLIEALLNVFAKEKVRILRRVSAPGSRVLDVGAGRGRFVTTARAAGYAVSGIEPSRQGISLSTAAGADVRQASIEDAGVADESLDVVTLWHVLEHLEDPAAAIRSLSAWLRPGGIIIVAVPNLASLQAWIGRNRWFHLDVPRHRTHFSPAGLDALMRSAGLDPFFERHVLLEHNAYGMWQTWTNHITSSPAYLYNLLKRNVPLRGSDVLRTAAAAALIPVAVIIELGAGVLGRGGTFVVAARRR
jgi:SAM-dependent methyltransferase